MHGTHRLSKVPLRVVLLVIGQAEGGVQHRVVHTVVNQTVGLWVETLCVCEHVCVCVGGDKGRKEVRTGGYGGVCMVCELRAKGVIVGHWT